MKKQILLWIWCFPQNLVGLIVKHVTKAKSVDNHYWFKVERDSISLGEYIFICPKHYGNRKVLRHEKGHQKQSRMLGWLYLPLIALPSLLWAWYFCRRYGKPDNRYYKFYTEAWADKLGGVARNK